MKNLIKTARRRWGLNDTEKCFVQQAQSLFRPAVASARNRPKRVLVQMAPDYQCMIKFLGTLHADEELLFESTGLWHQNVMSAPRGERFPIPKQIVRRIFNVLDYLKWKRIYKSIGVGNFVNLECGPVLALSNFRRAHRIWRSLETSQDVLSISLRGTNCGDLIYDTYLRYRLCPTIDVRDRYLRTLIWQALNAQSAIRRHLAKNAFDRFLTNYSIYIQHGIPVREALRAGVEVLSCGNLSQVYKKLSLDDMLHVPRHWRYREMFDTVIDKEGARNQAKLELEKRFNGVIDKATAYMRTSAYGGDTKSALPNDVIGVVFLHDFFDSPHCYRYMAFPDFDAWIRFTLDTIVEENLPIAVKPHPNQLPESAKLVRRLQDLYPSVTFLDSSLSNAAIFRSGIKCGVSVYGTVLGELAFHGIAALAAGDHPHVDFDIAITAKSKEDYRAKLVGFRGLKAPANARSQMLEFYYTHQLLESNDLDIDFGTLDVHRLAQNSTEALAMVMDGYPPFLKTRKGDEL